MIAQNNTQSNNFNNKFLKTPTEPNKSKERKAFVLNKIKLLLSKNPNVAPHVIRNIDEDIKKLQTEQPNSPLKQQFNSTLKEKQLFKPQKNKHTDIYTTAASTQHEQSTNINEIIELLNEAELNDYIYYILYKLYITNDKILRNIVKFF